MHHAPATCVAVAATPAAAATTVTTTAAAAAAAAATAEADSSAVPERERIHTSCCRCFSCGGSTALLGLLLLSNFLTAAATHVRVQAHALPAAE